VHNAHFIELFAVNDSGFGVGGIVVGLELWHVLRGAVGLSRASRIWTVGPSTDGTGRGAVE
jgi:hypothetical protein